MATSILQCSRSRLLPGVGSLQNVHKTFITPQLHGPLSAAGPQGGVRHAGGKLKDLKSRIKTAGSVAKITKSLKLIASARLRAATDRVDAARPFAAGPQKPFEFVREKAAEASKDKKPDTAPKTEKGRNIILTVTSDRGLCGALNGQVVRLVDEMDKAQKLADTKVVTLGDKGVQLLTRGKGDKIIAAFGNTSKKPLSFLGAGLIVDKILSVDDKFDGISVVYNNFVNRVLFKTVNKDFDGMKSLGTNPTAFNTFDWQDEGVNYQLRDLFEFQLASFLYNAHAENTAAELSSRMMSMDGATKNANEMAKRLTQLYNRGRQAGITTELIEITSGAEALKAQS